MKMRKVLPVMLLAATALTGCAKEVTYAEFHEKAAAAEKDSYATAVLKFKGTTRSDGATTELNKSIEYTKTALLGWQVKEGQDASIVYTTIGAIVLSTKASSVSEEDSYKYYLNGSEFKVTDSTRNVEFDKYGCITSYAEKGDTSDFKVTVKYSK